MKTANLIIISLCLSVSILPSVVHADMVGSSPGSSPTDLLITIAAIIGIIALIAWLVIRNIKKYYDLGRKT